MLLCYDALLYFKPLVKPSLGTALNAVVDRYLRDASRGGSSQTRPELMREQICSVAFRGHLVRLSCGSGMTVSRT